MKPFMKYPGGKVREIPLIEKYAPKNIERYFEPFVGGGAVFFGIPFKKSLLNDYSEDLIGVYRCIQTKDETFFKYLNDFIFIWKQIETKANVKSLFKKFDYLNNGMYDKYLSSALKKKENTIKKIQNSGIKISEKDLKGIRLTAKKTAVYMLYRELYNNKIHDKTLHLSAYYVMREYCYSSMFRYSKNGDFNVPYGGMSYNDKYLDEKIKYMLSDDMSSKMKNVVIDNLDFEEFLCNYKFSETDFVFLDPPYDSEFSTYDQNEFDKNEQVRLFNCIKKIKAKWMLIIKKTDFINNLYKDFFVYEYDKNYTVSFKNRNDKDVKHLLITNYSLGD